MKTLSEVANFFENIKEFTTCFYLQVLFIYQDFYRLTRNFIYKKKLSDKLSILEMLITLLSNL